MTPKRAQRLRQEARRQDDRRKFVDFLGQWKHMTYPIERLEEGIEEGFGFDGSRSRGWQRDQLVRHADDAGPVDRRSSIRSSRRRRCRSCATSSIRSRTSRTRADPRTLAKRASRVPQVDRHRRHRVLRSRGRVLHLRLDPLLRGAEPLVLQGRLRRGRLEQPARRGRRQPRLQAADQGRLLPVAARPISSPTCARRW